MSSETMSVVPPTRRRFALPHSARWPLGFAIAALALFALYYFVYYGPVDPDFKAWVQRWLSIASMNESLVWIMCALGLNIVVGYAGLLDLGFVAFWAIGGYTVGWLMSAFFQQVDINILGTAPAGQRGIHINFWIVLVIAGALCALMGVFIGAPTLRLRSDYLALVTLGFGEIIPQLFYNGDNFLQTGFNLTNGTKGILPVDPVEAAAFDKSGVGFRNLGVFDHLSKYVIFVFLVVIIVFVSLRLREGRLGRAWLAIREDELAASAMGVPLMRTKLSAYAVGAIAGGFGGAAFAIHINGVLPDRFKFDISIILLAMVVLGGMGNVWGVILGAFAISWVNSTGLPQAGNAFNESFGTNIDFPSFNFLLFGAVLVLMMLFRREGILPEARTRLVLREPGRTEAESLGADMEAQAPELEALPDVEVAGEATTDEGKRS
ncbi:branched-chain amino acid ABC transporter permease [Luedemannella helvata]|uniref:Branched-chain amino acid ABC transporter permease n=1 Tax=Luedemannella helvata TaxID=349315 RepID=A0ABN2KTC6_9ACTN